MLIALFSLFGRNWSLDWKDVCASGFAFKDLGAMRSYWDTSTMTAWQASLWFRAQSCQIDCRTQMQRRLRCSRIPHQRRPSQPLWWIEDKWAKACRAAKIGRMMANLNLMHFVGKKGFGVDFNGNLLNVVAMSVVVFIYIYLRMHFDLDLHLNINMLELCQ